MVSVDIEGSLGRRLVNGEDFQRPGVAKDEGGTQAGLPCEEEFLFEF